MKQDLDNYLVDINLTEPTKNIYTVESRSTKFLNI